jgi:hypothetical protein
MCVGQQLFSSWGLWVLASQKNLNFTMYMKQMVLFTFVMQHSGLTSFVMSSRQMQDLVKLGLTSGCQDDRGNVDETTIGDLCEYHVM